MKRNVLRFLCLFLVLITIMPIETQSQSTFAPTDYDYNFLVNRYEILSGDFSHTFHSSVKPYQRKHITDFAEKSLAKEGLTRSDRFNLQFILNDNWEFSDSAKSSSNRTLLGFYKRPAAVYSVNTNNFKLNINPVIYLAAGVAKNREKLFVNTRGVELRGLIDDKVGFYAFAADNQAYFPAYADFYVSNILAVPGEGYTKPFKTTGYDFFTARGYVSFNPVKSILVQFGHDKNFIGNGYRSLILSDHSSSYTFLKINTNVWKVNYTNLFAELNADVYYLNKLMPKKYLTFHHLSVNIGKHLNIGLFESIIFSRGDSGRGGYDVNYLNPIIFYRSIEQQLGSDGNSLLGMDFKLNFLKRFSFYGQLILDEFYLQHIKAQDGWWANKWGTQLGLKYINAVGLKNFDLQIETNIIRPFTYSHLTKATSYSHYNHPLAHPMGANFTEFLAIAKYQPFPKWTFTGKIFHIQYGADSTTTNYGGNVLKSYTTRSREFGNTTGQGYNTEINYVSLTASFQLKHNVFIDLTPVIRIQDSQLATLTKSDKFVMAAFRWNISQRLHEF